MRRNVLSTTFADGNKTESIIQY